MWYVRQNYGDQDFSPIVDKFTHKCQWDSLENHVIPQGAAPKVVTEHARWPTWYHAPQQYEQQAHNCRTLPFRYQYHSGADSYTAVLSSSEYKTALKMTQCILRWWRNISKLLLLKTFQRSLHLSVGLNTLREGWYTLPSLTSEFEQKYMPHTDHKSLPN